MNPDSHPGLNGQLKEVAPRTWTIRPDGTGDAPTIQLGIDRASPHDTLLVEPGTYYENITFRGKDVALVSQIGYAATIIDGSHGVGATVTFAGGETQRAVLEGFTVTGGQVGTTSNHGAGIYVGGASPSIRWNRVFRNIATAAYGHNGSAGGVEFHGVATVTSIIEDNVFEENESTSNGGALGIFGQTRVIVRRNVFIHNRSGTDGGAIWVYPIPSQPAGQFCHILDNTFIENTAGDHGGAIDADLDIPYVISRNLFLRNTAHGTDGTGNTGVGGAIAVRGSDATIVDNSFVENSATGLDACSGGAILASGNAHLSVARNIFYNCLGCAVLCIEGSYVALGSSNLFWGSRPRDTMADSASLLELGSLTVFADPLFCDPSTGDFHVPVASPAVKGGIAIGAFPIPGCDGSYIVKTRDRTSQ